MMSLVTIAIFTVVTWACAVIQADEHHYMIRHGLMSVGVKRDWTIMRAFVLGVLSLATWCLGLVPWTSALALFVGSWGAFSFIFRRNLNGLMKWDTHYLGSTSVYDVFFIRVALFLQEWRWASGDAIRATHQAVYQHSGDYRKTVHLAEKIMSAIELGAAVLAAGITILSR